MIKTDERISGSKQGKNSGTLPIHGSQVFFLFGTILMRHSRVNISKPEKIETVRHHKVL